MPYKLFCRLAISVGALGLGVIMTADMAQAANNVGWVLADQPNATSPYTPDPAHSFNSAHGTITVVPGASSYTEVDFENLYTGAPDNVQVSAYNSQGWCISVGWGSQGTTLRVAVQCYGADGIPTTGAFTLLYQSRSAPFSDPNRGIAYLWAAKAVRAHTLTLPSAQSFNSTAGTNTIRRNFAGNYTVTLPGLTRLGGNVQVSAYYATEGVGLGPLPRCKVVDWGASSSGTTATVQCLAFPSAPQDLSFLLTYAIGEPFGLVPGAKTVGAWVFANNLTSTSVYTPNANFQYNGFGTGRLTAQQTGTGQYTITIPGTLSYSSSVALVTATGNNNAFCNIVDWATATIHVACYHPRGILADTRFNLVFQSVE